MASDTRARMIEGAALLLAKRGLQETSFSEVLDLTKTPRGSIYHHFPNGKDQLVSSAVEFAGRRANDAMATIAGQPATEVTARFLALWRDVLVRSSYRVGCSVLAVTVATDSPALLGDAADVFRAWRATLASLLEQGGLAAADAAPFATLLIASTEGAVVMSRAEQSMEPLELVGAQLLEQVARLELSN